MKIGYARVSTRDQSLQLQVDALKAAGCEKIYQEVASGAKSTRYVLDDLLKNIREGDILIVWRGDRLARSLKHFISVTAELDQRKINFISITEKFDTTSAMGKSMFQMNAVFAELERNIGIERSEAGRLSAKARGRVGGRPKGLTEKAKTTAKIAAVLYKTGDISIREICRQLNICFRTLYRYLEHEGVEIGSSPIKKVVNCV